MYKPAWRQSAQNARSSEGAAEATQTSALGERERERESMCVCVRAREGQHSRRFDTERHRRSHYITAREITV
jgi:hypothetical protein